MTKALLIPTSKSAPVMLPSQGLRTNVHCSSSALCRKALSGVTARLGCLPISLQHLQRGGEEMLILLCRGHPQAWWRCENHQHCRQAGSFLPGAPPGSFLPAISRSMAKLADTHHCSKPTPHTKHIWHGNLKKKTQTLKQVMLWTLMSLRAPLSSLLSVIEKKGEVL